MDMTPLTRDQAEYASDLLWAECRKYRDANEVADKSLQDDLEALRALSKALARATINTSPTDTITVTVTVG